MSAEYSEGYWKRLKHSRQARLRAYDVSHTEVHEGTVVDMTTSSHANAQVSLLPDGDGFLIRVWPDDGLHEFGGQNGDFFSAVIRSVDGVMTLDHLNINEYARKGQS